MQAAAATMFLMSVFSIFPISAMMDASAASTGRIEKNSALNTASRTAKITEITASCQLVPIMLHENTNQIQAMEIRKKWIPEARSLAKPSFPRLTMNATARNAMLSTRKDTGTICLISVYVRTVSNCSRI